MVIDKEESELGIIQFFGKIPDPQSPLSLIVNLSVRVTVYGKEFRVMFKL